MLMSGSRTEKLLKSMCDHWPAVDEPWHRLAVRLRRVSELLSRSAQRHLDRADLTPMEYDVLTTLRRAAPPHELRPSDLCLLMMASSGGMSIVLKKLQGRGLVALSTAEHDARSKIVRLTDAGRALIETVAQAVAGAEREYLGRVADEAEIDALAQRLAELLTRMDE